MEVALGCRVARVTLPGLWTKRGSHQTVGTMAPTPGWGLWGDPLWVVLTGLWVAFTLVFAAPKGRLELCLSPGGQAGLTASAQTWGVCGLSQWRFFFNMWVGSFCPVCKVIIRSNNKRS